jgi:hypothetical protein
MRRDKILAGFSIYAFSSFVLFGVYRIAKNIPTKNHYPEKSFDFSFSGSFAYIPVCGKDKNTRSAFWLTACF